MSIVKEPGNQQSDACKSPMSPAAQAGLPDPEHRLGSYVVIWDGQCNFCRAQVERLARFDWFSQLSYLSLHDERVAALCPTLGEDALMEQMWVRTPIGELHGGADAVRFLTRALPGLWWLMPLMHVPFAMPVWRWMYRKVAQRRYKIAGRDCSSDACEIHLK